MNRCARRKYDVRNSVPQTKYCVKPYIYRAIICAWLAVAGSCFGDEIANLKDLTRVPEGVIISGNMTSGQKVELLMTFYSASVVRVHYGIGRLQVKPSLLLDGAQPVIIPFVVEDTDSAYIITTANISIQCRKQLGRISFCAEGGKNILEECSGKGMQLLQETVTMYFTLSTDDHFYGFGEKFGVLDKAGTCVECMNRDAGDSHGDETYVNIPFFMNPKGYGIFFHTTWRTEYHLGDLSKAWFSIAADGGDMDFFFIYGPGFKDILRAYADLTGHMPLPPKWAFGLWHGTYTGGHKGRAGFGQNEFLEIAETFREKGIPCDVLRIDSNWDDLTGSDYIWHKSYPDPVSMIEEVRQAGFKMSLHDRPIPYGVLRKYPLRMGWLVPPQNEYLDFSIPDAAQWWWRRHEVLMDMGVDAFKPDIGEEIPDVAEFANGMNGKEMRNHYAKLYVKTVFEGQKAYSGKRAVVFARSGYAGSQKYPLIWGGDQHYSRWDQLPPLIRAGQCIGLSGIPLWSHDIGGIGTQKGIIPPADLYCRWAQFGFLNGVPQTFGRPWREPWKYDQKAYDGIDVTSIFRKYDELHYRLMPYIYSLVWEAHQTGLPLMRAMVLEFQDDPRAWAYDLQYMFGSAFLAGPVFEGNPERRIYLPGEIWYDYWSNEIFQGPQEITVRPPVDQLPLFVRGGSIIPMGPVMQYIGKKTIEPLYFDIYPFEESQFLLYEDDGESYQYENEDYQTRLITCKAHQDMTKITFFKAEGSYENVDTKTVLLQVHQIRPARIRIAREKVRYFDEESSWEKAELGWIYNKDKQVILVKIPYPVVKKGITLFLEN